MPWRGRTPPTQTEVLLSDATTTRSHLTLISPIKHHLHHLTRMLNPGQRGRRPVLYKGKSCQDVWKEMIRGLCSGCEGIKSLHIINLESSLCGDKNDFSPVNSSFHFITFSPHLLNFKPRRVRLFSDEVWEVGSDSCRAGVWQRARHWWECRLLWDVCPQVTSPSRPQLYIFWPYSVAPQSYPRHIDSIITRWVSKLVITILILATSVLRMWRSSGRCYPRNYNSQGGSRNWRSSWKPSTTYRSYRASSPRSLERTQVIHVVDTNYFVYKIVKTLDMFNNTFFHAQFRILFTDAYLHM